MKRNNEKRPTTTTTNSVYYHKCKVNELTDMAVHETKWNVPRINCMLSNFGWKNHFIFLIYAPPQIQWLAKLLARYVIADGYLIYFSIVLFAGACVCRACFFFLAFVFFHIRHQQWTLIIYCMLINTFRCHFVWRNEQIYIKQFFVRFLTANFECAVGRESCYH